MKKSIFYMTVVDLSPNKGMKIEDFQVGTAHRGLRCNQVAVPQIRRHYYEVVIDIPMQ